MSTKVLRYNISDWKQLTQCLSNTSSAYHIKVREANDGDYLQGTIIEVVHDKLGVLFSYLVDASGNLIDTRSSGKYDLTVAEVLDELSRFGFLITFDRVRYLSEAQLNYLRTLKDLNYDKLRVLYVREIVSGVEVNTPHIVVFNILENPGWMDNKYACPKEEFLEALDNGSAMNLDDVSETKKYRWDWLDFVADIQDILDDNIPPSPEPEHNYTNAEIDEMLSKKQNLLTAELPIIIDDETDVISIDLSDYATKQEVNNYVVQLGSSFNLTIGQSDYVVTFELTNLDGEVLHSESIDLPLETMIVNVDYDSETKELILTLKNGNTVRVDISDIISGLVDTDTFNQAIQDIQNALSNKVDKIISSSSLELQRTQKSSSISVEEYSMLEISCDDWDNYTMLMYLNNTQNLIDISDSVNSGDIDVTNYSSIKLFYAGDPSSVTVDYTLTNDVVRLKQFNTSIRSLQDGKEDADKRVETRKLHPGDHTPTYQLVGDYTKLNILTLTTSFDFSNTLKAKYTKIGDATTYEMDVTDHISRYDSEGVDVYKWDTVSFWLTGPTLETYDFQFTFDNEVVREVKYREDLSHKQDTISVTGHITKDGNTLGTESNKIYPAVFKNNTISYDLSDYPNLSEEDIAISDKGGGTPRIWVQASPPTDMVHWSEIEYSQQKITQSENTPPTEAYGGYAVGDLWVQKYYTPATVYKVFVLVDIAQTLPPKALTWINITGTDLSNYYTKTETDNLLDDKENKLEVGDGLKREGNVVSVALKEQQNYMVFTDGKLGLDLTSLGSLPTLRQALADTSHLYALASKTYVDNLISTSLKRLVVESLPTQDIDTNTIYMILKSVPTTNNIYDEYMYINNAWELIGSTEVDLSNYYTKSETYSKTEIDTNEPNIFHGSQDPTNVKADYPNVKIGDIYINTQIGSSSSSSSKIWYCVATETTIVTWHPTQQSLFKGSTPFTTYTDLANKTNLYSIEKGSLFIDTTNADIYKFVGASGNNLNWALLASGGSYTFTDGLTESSGTVSIDLASGSKLLIDANDKLDVDLSSKQDTIDSTHKLSADLVDDTNSTNKFVSANEKQTWNDKISVPTSTSADNGKFLRVVNGVATWDTVPQAESNSF